MTEITMNDLLAQENKRDPHTFYAQLRPTEPLIYVEGLDAWVLTTYEDTLWLLKDPRFIKDRRKVAGLGEHAPVNAEMQDAMLNMLMVDPPDHTRLRLLVSKAFTPRMIEQLRPRIQQITDELLDKVQGQGKMDLIADFAYPLPLTVICEMLGISVEDRQRFRAWTRALVNGERSAEERGNMIHEFLSYIRGLLNEKRAHPGPDLTSDLVQAENHGDQLTEQELISMIFLLILAGHETTVNLIGNGTLALLQHPEQFQLLRNDPALIPSAVEELLRYTAPVSLSDERWASEDIELHGKVIRAGQQVMAALVSANADPQHFHDGDTLDVTRQENQHLAFGKGIHFCLGAPLARMEGQIAFSTLLQRLPTLRLAEDPASLTWNFNPMLRGLVSLPVIF